MRPQNHYLIPELIHCGSVIGNTLGNLPATPSQEVAGWTSTLKFRVTGAQETSADPIGDSTAASSTHAD
jgi:hypothetical protein